jgi:hypothetical protein
MFWWIIDIIAARDLEAIGTLVALAALLVWLAVV